MKRLTTLAIAIASISTAAFAQTPAPTAPAAPAASATGTMPPHGAMMQQGGMMGDRMGRHMENVWDEMDSNKDGIISKEESSAFSAKKFDERDANHDGKVTKEEWDSFNTKKMEERRAKMGNMGDAPVAPAASMPAATSTEKK